MVVTDTELGWEDYAAAHSALTCGTVHDAAAQHERTGAEWPVSGDATTRAGTILHRQRPLFDLPRPPLRGVASGRLEYCPCTAGVACMECGE